MRYAVDRDEEIEVPKRQRGMGRNVPDDDREITLGTRSLLGIFFGLVLICGVFFGLGYSVGRVSARAVVPAPTETATPQATSLAKPSPQESVIPSPATAASQTDGTTAVIPEGTGTTPAPAASTTPAAATTTSLPVTPPAKEVAAATVFPSSPGVSPAPAVVPAVQKTIVPAISAGSLMVQVAAVSIPQDANILVAALRQHGYTAVVRHQEGDHLLHVQIGPFASRAQALAVRGKLLADGYNAVIK